MEFSTQAPLSPPLAQCNTFDAFVGSACDLSPFIHPEDYPTAQLEYMLSDITNCGMPPPDSAVTNNDNQRSTAVASEELADEGNRHGSAWPPTKAILDGSSDSCRFTKDQESASPDQSIGSTAHAAPPSDCSATHGQRAAQCVDEDLPERLYGAGSLEEADHMANGIQIEDAVDETSEGDTPPTACPMPRGDELANRVSAGPYAATAAGHGTPPHDRSPVGDELANRVSVRPHAAKAARQGTPPQDSCALDDGPTESRRHQSPDVGEVPRTSHPVKVSSVLVLVPVQDPTTHGSTGNRSACELTAEEANESSDAATSPRGNGCRAGSSSSRGLATPSTPASESGSPCGSMSGAADDTDSRRKRKRPAFKSPLPLMEGALSILSRLSGTPISRACGEGRSVDDPILLEDNEDGDGLLSSSPQWDRSLPPLEAGTRRSKRRRTRKSSYIAKTDNKVSSEFKALQKEFLRVERRQKEFADYLRDLGYPL